LFNKKLTTVPPPLSHFLIFPSLYDENGKKTDGTLNFTFPLPLFSPPSPYLFPSILSLLLSAGNKLHLVPMEMIKVNTLLYYGQWEIHDYLN